MPEQDKHIYSFENLLHPTNEKITQPENSYRELYNSYIVQVSDNQYAWRPLSGNSKKEDLPTGYSPIGICKIKEDLFCLFLIDASGNERIGLLTIVNDVATYDDANDYESTALDFDLTKPIEARGYYVSATEIWVHWVQEGVQPRVINMGVDNSTLDEDMLNYSPEVSWPNMNFYAETEGDLLHGTYFFFVQYIGDNGVRTDFSPISSPIKLSREGSGGTINDYQGYTGEDPNYTTEKGIQFQFTNVDTAYEKLRVGFFYSNGEEVYQNGVIFSEETIGGTTVTVDITSMLGLDTVLLADVLLYNAMIQEARAIEFIKNHNALGRVTMKDELPLSSSLNTYISNSKYELMADLTYIIETYDYPLFGHNQSESEIFPGIWYRTKASSTFPALITGTFDQLIKGTQNPTLSQPGEIVLETVHAEVLNYYNGDAITIEYMSSNGTRATHTTTVSTYDDATNKATLTTGIPGSLVSHISYKITHSITNPSFAVGTYFMFAEDLTVDNPATMQVEPMLRIKKYYSYNSGNQVYDNYSLADDWLDYKSTVIAEKCGTYKALDEAAYAVVFFNLQGKPFYARDLGIVSFPDIGTSNQLLEGYKYNAVSDYYQYYNHIINNIVINNLDITDIKDEVDGFLIVRTPVSRRIKSEGWIHPMYETPVTFDHMMYPGSLYSSGPTYMPNLYTYYSPEHLFGKESVSFMNDVDEIEIAGYLQALRPAYSGTVTNNPGSGWSNRGIRENATLQGFMHKMYRYEAREGVNTNGAIGKKSKILAHKSFSPKENVELFDTRDLTIELKNYLNFTDVSQFNGAGGQSILIRTDGDESTTNMMTDLGSTKPKITHVRHLSPAIDPRNEIGPLSTRRYISCGRYIKIDSTMLTNIENGGDYIINGLEVYGGDCFNALWDHIHYYPDEDEATDYPFGRAIVMPIVSEINIAMRHGNHVAQDRTYRTAVLTPNGLRYATGAFKFEEFKYNFGYSSREIENVYPAYPLDYEDDSLGKFSYIWSEKKDYGERFDSYRVFKTANRVVMEPSKGEIVALSEMYDFLIVFRPDGIAFVPIGQRTLISEGEGYEVQVGAGSEFVRYDERTIQFGCSHKHAIQKTPSGIIFYDNRRKAICELTGSGQKVIISSALDMRPYMRDKTYKANVTDNPFNGKGFLMSYDGFTDQILFTIMDAYTAGSLTDHTLQYNMVKKRIVGMDQRVFATGFSSEDYFYTLPGEKFRASSINDDIYLENVPGVTTLYGTEFEAEMHLILNKNALQDKIFDSYELIYENHAPIEMDVITKAGTKTIYWSQTKDHEYAKNTSVDRRYSVWGPFPSFNRMKSRGKYIELKIRTTERSIGGAPILSGIIIKSRKAL